MEAEFTNKFLQLGHPLFFVSAMDFQHCQNIVYHGKLSENGGFLSKVTDAFLCTPVHRVAGNFLAPEKYLALSGFNYAHDHIASGWFPRSGGTEQTGELALLYLKG